MLPGWPRRPYDPAPILLPDGVLHPLHLAVEMRAPGPDAGVANAPAFRPTASLPAELGTVVCLDAVRGEGKGGRKPFG